MAQAKITDPGDQAGGWRSVWAGRRLDPSQRSVLAQLVAADGYDSFGPIDEEAWSAYVASWATRLQVRPGMSIFEVGCGAGAFLYVLRQMGCTVAGIDQSPALIDAARAAMPDGEFAVCDAADVPVEPRVDLVISVGVLFYFPDLSYTRAVVERMAAKAKKAVLLLRLPDSAQREDAVAYRVARQGGREAYAERYSGLEHLYFKREWAREALEGCGLTDIQVADQQEPTYGDASYRFDAWGRVPATVTGMRP